ncbi:PAS domain S-box protein [Aerosakkonema funiforme]|uniref:PAS domain S-box protein n=1 Tax=Aerosakkonema funiforme FACHB-1375 TaxID=2949571 RepID=A0A926VM64_9CYAN|nr:PAS domain S-box protein [Aerosakkonema funiforme]MBD2185024.1 PAS domain S-box protein [Aerosakkonema funiforme FACHB-1375]
MEDTTEGRKIQAEVRLLEAMTLAIAQSQDFHTALGEALRQVCEATGWKYGEVWIPRLDGTALECSPVWYGSTNNLEKFRKLSEALTFPHNIGLPGRVWSSKQPEWIKDVSNEPDSIFLRCQMALEPGLKAGLGIPILDSDRVLAVLVFFMFESREEDNQLVDLVSGVATQLGSLIAQKRMQEVLKTQARVLESMVEGVNMCDENGFIFFTNAAFDAMFGYERGESIGKHISDFDANSSGENAWLIERINQQLQIQGSWCGEFKNCKKDGTPFITYVRISALEISGKKYWICVREDITDRKIAEEELQTSKRRLANLIDSLPGIAFSCANDPQWSMKYLSEGCLDLTGYKSEELLGDGISYNALTHPEDLPKVLNAIKEAVSKKQPYVVEYRINTKFGLEKWLWEKGRAVFDEKGEVRGLEGFITDITDRKRAEEALLQERNFVSAILDTASSLVVVLNQEGKVIRLNRACEKTTGYLFDELRHKYFWDIFLIPEENKQVKAIFEDLQAGKSLNQHENYWLTKDGSLRLIAWSNSVLLDADGSVKYIIATGIDITDRKQAEEALRQAERQYRSIFENAVEGIFQTTVNGHYLIANPMLARIYGYDSPSELLSALTDIEHQLYVDCNRRAEFMSLVKERGAVWGFESQVYRKDGSVIWISENAYALYDGEGRLVGYEGTVVDITERKRAEATIQYQAYHDLLTNLPNRNLFNDRLDLSLANSHRNHNKLAVMFLDLDCFKTINDTLGHAVGDRLLQLVAERLTSCLREGDTVARWGGDEFTILLPQIHSLQEVGKVAQRLVDAFKLPFNLQDAELYISSSIGIALYPHDGQDLQTLLKNADMALYKAKENGRNNYQFHIEDNNLQNSVKPMKKRKARSPA